MMADQKMAISTHAIVTCPPQLSDNEISPKAAKDFENNCLNYFVNAKGGINDDLKVSRILICFENDLVNDWISVNEIDSQPCPLQTLWSNSGHVGSPMIGSKLSGPRYSAHAFIQRSNVLKNGQPQYNHLMSHYEELCLI